MALKKELSIRETGIVKLICNGMSDGEIAKQLSLSSSTARTHRKRILQKLNLTKTVLLVRYAIDNKII